MGFLHIHGLEKRTYLNYKETHPEILIIINRNFGHYKAINDNKKMQK